MIGQELWDTMSAQYKRKGKVMHGWKIINDRGSFIYRGPLN